MRGVPLQSFATHEECDRRYARFMAPHRIVGINSMTIPRWLIGLAILSLPLAFVVFAFRQGLNVKPDPNKRHGVGEYDAGGSSDGHAGGGSDGHAS
jgi:hypothetical protein